MLCTFCVQEGGFEGPENRLKRRRINSRLISNRPKTRVAINFHYSTVQPQSLAILSQHRCPTCRFCGLSSAELHPLALPRLRNAATLVSGSPTPPSEPPQR